MAVDYSVIGKRLKQARLAKNMTQEDLAEKIDISVAFLSRVERGNSHINLKRLSQVCNLLDVSVILFLKQFLSLSFFILFIFFISSLYWAKKQDSLSCL